MNERLSRTSRRASIQALRSLLARRSDLDARYQKAKDIIRIFRRPAFYEISTRCNLLCEGCYYFEGGYDRSRDTVTSPEKWDRFFREESQRGVSMAYFLGAEPALEQERLHIASRYFSTGNIGTNGTIKIDSEIPFRISISVWGDATTDARLRGANIIQKALKNFAGDPRAIVLYTLNHWNVKQARRVTELCRDAGLPITYNLYSPTRTFLEKLTQGVDHDKHFFRVSTSSDSLCLKDDDLGLIRREMANLMDDFPDTVIYSHSYNQWSTKPGTLYDIDPETKIARDCHSRITEPMRYYTTDLKTAHVKCCTFDVDCEYCRLYSGGWSSKFEPTLDELASAEAFEGWLDMIETIGRIFLTKGTRKSLNQVDTIS